MSHLWSFPRQNSSGMSMSSSPTKGGDIVQGMETCSWTCIFWHLQTLDVVKGCFQQQNYFNSFFLSKPLSESQVSCRSTATKTICDVCHSSLGAVDAGDLAKMARRWGVNRLKPYVALSMGYPWRYPQFHRIFTSCWNIIFPIEIGHLAGGIPVYHIFRHCHRHTQRALKGKMRDAIPAMISWLSCPIEGQSSNDHSLIPGAHHLRMACSHPVLVTWIPSLFSLLE